MNILARLGVGLWGQLDMGGDAQEWILDWFEGPYVDPCVDCAYLSPSEVATNGVVLRGDDYYSANLNSGARNGFSPTSRAFNWSGFRCARTP